MPEIVLTDLNKYFGDVGAVKDLDLVIPDGAFFTLLGPSGCGKTTTLRMIAGLTKPTTGQITIGGKTVFDSTTWTIVPPGKRKLGMVFQSYALWPHMTVWENIAFPLRIKKMSADTIKTKIDTVMDQVQIRGLEKRYASELSGGQQQRVAVARELVTGVDVLLMDEPLGNLDAQLRIEMRSELKKLHASTGQTIIYVTHDQLEAMTMSTHVAVMKDGLLQQLSGPDDIYAKPRNTFVAEFIGDTPINLLDMEVKEGRLESKKLGIQLPLTEQHKKVKGKVILGIRPECLKVVTEQSPTTIKAIVDTVLPAGSEVLLRIRLHEEFLNIVAPRGVQATMDQDIYIDFDMNEVCIFDQDTGTNLLAG